MYRATAHRDADKNDKMETVSLVPLRSPTVIDMAEASGCAVVHLTSQQSATTI
jgi:hypothetical protein